MQGLRASIEGRADSFARNMLLIDLASLEAERAFRRSRRRAFWARIALRLAGSEPTLRAGDEGRGVPFELRIEDVAGLAGRGPGLPGLPRSLAPRWKLEYLRDEGLGSTDEAFSVTRAKGQWLLEGGFRELLRLELLRARGRPTILARVSDRIQRADIRSYARPAEPCLADCLDSAAS